MDTREAEESEVLTEREADRTNQAEGKDLREGHKKGHLDTQVRDVHFDLFSLSLTCQ